METAQPIGSNTSQQLIWHDKSNVWDGTRGSEAVLICDGNHCWVISLSTATFFKEHARRIKRPILSLKQFSPVFQCINDKGLPFQFDTWLRTHHLQYIFALQKRHQCASVPCNKAKIQQTFVKVCCVSQPHRHLQYSTTTITHRRNTRHEEYVERISHRGGNSTKWFGVTMVMWGLTLGLSW